MSVPVPIRLELAVKRMADALVAAVALILLVPMFACIAVAIKVEDPHSPLFFNDWVMGRRQTRFRMFKFLPGCPARSPSETTRMRGARWTPRRRPTPTPHWRP
jgi:lipopolysaccharide/colanic/teichoic acid biosynthesis glycosyltransferase